MLFYAWFNSEMVYKVGALVMYAVMETGGKQYKVEKGDVIYTEKLEVSESEPVEFKVLAYSDGKNFDVGFPYLENVKVMGKVLETKRGKKVTVFTYKPKKGCKRKMGHRQWQSKVEIVSIVSGADSLA